MTSASPRQAGAGDNSCDDAVREASAAPESEGERLDRWMAETGFPDLSRTRCKVLVEEGRLTVDGAALTDPKAKVRAGALYRLSVPAAADPAPQPEDIPLTVLFEDTHLIVVDKPAGMAVHPAVGNWTGTLVNALLHHCRGQLSGIGGVARPGIVHRLDKDTSGVMVAAKTEQAHHGLAALFAAHDIERAYLAVVRFAPPEPAGLVEAALARSAHDRKKMAVTDGPRGKHAVTHYETLERYGQARGQSAGRPGASLVRCVLETGRTHQIRVHMAHIGCPLLGDPVYGKQRGLSLEGAGEAVQSAAAAARSFQRQALHAAVLGFAHPVTDEEMRFETAPPADMQALIAALRALN